MSGLAAFYTAVAWVIQFNDMKFTTLYFYIYSCSSKVCWEVSQDALLMAAETFLTLEFLDTFVTGLC